VIVQPVIANGECSGELCDIEEMTTVPVVRSSTEWLGSVGSCVLKIALISDAFTIDLDATDLQFIPGPLGKLVVPSDTEGISIRFHAHLQFTGDIKHTTFSIHAIGNKREAHILSGISDNCLVPFAHVGIAGNEAGECVPLVFRCDETGTILSDVGGLRGGGFEWIFRPFGLCAGDKGGGNESCVCLLSISI
jgi:hypothetical protein